MRQAAYSLETLKLTRADEDPNISRLMRELRAFDRNADSEEDSDREALTAD
jgi:hypothetical protein